MAFRRHIVLATLLFLGTASAATANACDAEGFVLSAGRAFTSASSSGSAAAFSSAAARFADTRSIALFALGPHRKKVSGKSEAEYVRLARAYMGKFMSRHAARFNAAGLKVTGCNGNIVSASAGGGRKIVFRVSRTGHGFLVQDVNVSSIWLAAQMRSTFVSVLNRNNGDMNALLSYLKG